MTLVSSAACESQPRDRTKASGPSPAGQLAACVNCHGDGFTPAPPRSTSGSSSTSDIGVGAHASHLKDGALRGAVACTECHAPVGDLSHIDGVARVTFGPLASADGATPAWNRTEPAPSCATTYCHGATLGGGTNTTPIWTKVDGTQASCGSCHGLPPPLPHVQTTDCGSCHTGYTATRVDPAKHIDGIVQLATATAGDAPIACGSCHGIPPPPPHVTSTSCGNCHTGYSAVSVNPALHGNGVIDVATAGGPGGVACGSCHSIPPPPPHTASTSCGTCHTGYTATEVNAALHQNGRVDVLAQSCNSCHGVPPRTGRHQHEDHVNRSCGDCHAGYTRTAANAALHLNGTADVGNRITSFDRNTGNCTTTCHEREEW